MQLDVNLLIYLFMLIYLCFIYFNDYGKIKICIKNDKLIGAFLSFSPFFPILQ